MSDDDSKKWTEGLDCSKCKVIKLSGEFPMEISVKCQHAASYCLKCVCEALKGSLECPECKITISEEDKVRLQREYDAVLADGPDESKAQPSQSGGQILPPKKVTITLLDGHHFEIDTKGDPDFTVAKLKEAIFVKEKFPRRKQELYFNSQQLKDSDATLVKCGITTDSNLQLVILMLAITDIKELVFDLSWGYPDTGKDFLDGSCLVFNSSMEQLCLIDYRNREKKEVVPGTYHTGDQMDEEKKTGHHKIHVQLDSLPPTVQQLFFTLSAWNATTLGAYKNPSVSLHDSAKPDDVLCAENFEGTKDKRALILCCLYRAPTGTGWRVSRMGTGSDGNAKNYLPISETIKKLKPTSYYA